MAKHKYLELLMWIIGIITSLAIGGAFISGMFTTVMILSYLPLLVHQIVGWIIVVSALITLGLAIYKKAKKFI